MRIRTSQPSTASAPFRAFCSSRTASTSTRSSARCRRRCSIARSRSTSTEEPGTGERGSGAVTRSFAFRPQLLSSPALPLPKRMSRLYIVSTPIGNLEDMSARAVTVLKSASRVLAEDTRRTAILFRRYGIGTPLVSAHEHNEAARAQQLLSWLESGDSVALVTDAGTPLLSDPGARLVDAVIAGGHDVIAIPGASALLAALVISGLPAEPFTFFGFPPRSGRERSEL